MVDGGTLAVWLAAGAGLLLSFVLERLMRPGAQPPARRPRAALLVHAGAWLAVDCVLALALGRPWFAATLASAAFLLLVLVNNAKMRSLHEPFVFQDLEYFVDALRHPRLYMPFFGWRKTLVATTGFALAVALDWWLEDPPADLLSWARQAADVALVAALALALLRAGNRSRPELSLDPQRDLRELGLLASLWFYGRAERTVPALVSPFDGLDAREGTTPLPNLVAVQSESFFDPRRLHAGIRPDVLGQFDALKRLACRHGPLRVPAWGANTVRTEFAFLSGIDEQALGVHRFNPYRRAARSGVATLAGFLRRLGYRTVCIHPYPASFYARDRVFPLLGFDRFIDLREFEGAPTAGPYVGDLALAARIADVLAAEPGPTFVFAITMENHGPLGMEAVAAGDAESLYDRPPPAGCEELTIYLRHLRNADGMLAALGAALRAGPRPAGLCWFGDHVPIMPRAYDVLGLPPGETDYLIWNTAGSGGTGPECLEIRHLARTWLEAMGLCAAPAPAGGAAARGVRAPAAPPA